MQLSRASYARRTHGRRRIFSRRKPQISKPRGDATLCDDGGEPWPCRAFCPRGREGGRSLLSGAPTSPPRIGAISFGHQRKLVRDLGCSGCSASEMHWLVIFLGKAG